MRILKDDRGVTSLEFSLIAVIFLFFMIAFFDLGRYAITVHSLKTLASASARQLMINCYNGQLIAGASPATCTTDPYTDTQKQAIAPFLYVGGLTPIVTISAGGSALTVTASQPNMTMILPVWGTDLNAPSVTTTLPF